LNWGEQIKPPVLQPEYSERDETIAA
jgi:hypothetical protein